MILSLVNAHRNIVVEIVRAVRNFKMQTVPKRMEIKYMRLLNQFWVKEKSTTAFMFYLVKNLDQVQIKYEKI